MKVESILNIWAFLHEHHTGGITVREISRLTGEGEKDVRQAIAVLESSPFYFPVYCEGEFPEEKYFVLKDGRQSYPQVSFSLGELTALLAILSRALELDSGSKETAHNLRRKLEYNFYVPPKVEYHKGMEHLKNAEKIINIKRKIEESLLLEEALRISYYSREKGEKVEFNLIPLGMILDGNTGLWYLLVSFNKLRPCRDLQFFRLDCIIEVKKEGSFDYPKDFDLQQFMKLYWGVQPGNPITVAVRFINEANVVAKAKKALTYRCPPGRLTEKEDGSLLYEGEVVGMDVFRAWLRSFGSSVEVLKPLELREAMINTARKLYEMYKE